MDAFGNLKINASDSIVVSVDASGNYTFTTPTNAAGDIDFYYTISDGNGGEIEASNNLKIAPKPKEYTAIESEGNITLVKDQDRLVYALDSQGDYQAITLDGQQIYLGMWGDDWDFLGAENINGVNSVIWKFTDTFGGADSFWLSQHNDQWEFVDSGDPGWQGDPNYNDPPDDQFYRTEDNFNLDLNDDGHVGAPPVAAREYTAIESEGNITLVKDLSLIHI